MICFVESVLYCEETLPILPCDDCNLSGVIKFDLFY